MIWRRRVHSERTVSVFFETWLKKIQLSGHATLVQLPTVQDASQDEAVSAPLEAHLKPSPTASPADDSSTDTASKRSSRMATWIQDVESKHCYHVISI